MGFEAVLAAGSGVLAELTELAVCGRRRNREGPPVAPRCMLQCCMMLYIVPSYEPRKLQVSAGICWDEGLLDSTHIAYSNKDRRCL